MSEFVRWMKDVYTMAKSGRLEWKPIYPNNMPCNGIDGVYTELNFEKDGKYQYIKYSIKYMSRCDEDGISHPEEGTKYYVLHELRLEDLEEKIVIPEPDDNVDLLGETGALMVNDYGRFRYVFDDEETARKVVCSEMLHLIYPYQYILNDDELKEWGEFLETNNYVGDK